MNTITAKRWGLFIALLLLAGVAREARASDWPQFMRVPERTGDADDEELKLPLGLAAQVKLADAVMTSPAVVGGLAYVVDQMGTAYCVDPKAGRVVWQASPDGEKAMGSNTSSPCVVKGRMYYGTTAGNFYILDAKNGAVIKSLGLGWPIISPPVAANDSIYIMTVGAVIHCLDLDGKERWRFDYYAQPVANLPKLSGGWGSHACEVPHYASGELCVSGKKVLVTCGYDYACLEDEGTGVSRSWTIRTPVALMHGVPRGISVCGENLYVAMPGTDGLGCIARASLKDGLFREMYGLAFRSKDTIQGQYQVLGTPAARGTTIYFGRHEFGFAAYEYKGTPDGWRNKWASYGSRTPAEKWTPSVTSPALSKDHAVFTTVGGEVIVVGVDSAGLDLDAFKPAPFRFQTPHRKMIASSPAISGGCVWFGCDDGFFYVLGPGGQAAPRTENLTLCEPRSKVVSATGKTYGWPYANADAANTAAVEDAGLRPPLRLRWAVRDFSIFKGPVTAGDTDLFLASTNTLLSAVEQSTGRVRWRRFVPTGYLHTAHRGAATVCGDRLFFVRGNKDTSGFIKRCLLYGVDARTGEDVWQAEVGFPGDWSRTAPICTGNVVVTATLHGTTHIPTVQAFDLKKGTEVWKVSLPEIAGKQGCGLGGCLLDGKLFYTRSTDWREGIKDRKGLTVAIDPADGKVLWKNPAEFGNSACLSGKDGKLFFGVDGASFACLWAKDGTVAWKSSVGGFEQAPAVGADCVVPSRYGGTASIIAIADGKPRPMSSAGGKPVVSLGYHTCAESTIVLPGWGVGATMGGLRIYDLQTGKAVWMSSHGFAPRVCARPIVTNGRIFINPQSDGMMYCFEPEKGGVK